MYEVPPSFAQVVQSVGNGVKPQFFPFLINECLVGEETDLLTEVDVHVVFVVSVTGSGKNHFAVHAVLVVEYDIGLRLSAGKEAG